MTRYRLIAGLAVAVALLVVATAVDASARAAAADDPDVNPTAVQPPMNDAQAPATVLIEALYYDTYGSGEPDEAVHLLNISPASVDLGGWRITDGESTVAFPAGTTLAADGAIWCARQATAFALQFGFPPDLEAEDTDPAVPELDGTWPRFANTGDECILQDGQGRAMDTLVYESGNPAVSGWQGPAVRPWTPTTVFAAEGQILYRKRDQRTGRPVPDTDTAADWAQDPADSIDGRRVLYPGWDLDAFFFSQQVTETATLTVAVAPDNLFTTVAGLLSGATEQVQIEGYSFRSRELADLLVERLDRGVAVTLLLEGDPAFEGISDQERWILDTLRQHGAQVLFMVNDSAADRHDRYKNQHAKFMIVDGQTVMIGTENLTETGMPADRQDNGTAGRRGTCLITDAPGVVARAGAVFAADADPDRHRDVVGCDQVPDLCTPPFGFVPELTPDWTTYTVQFPAPAAWRGTFAFEVIQAPENSLRTRDGLLGLLGRAGRGDTVLVQQLREDGHWGPAQGTPDGDPNPRLAAYLQAARRGARVRILLDGYLAEDGANSATAAYLRTVAQAEGLDLQARLGNPSFLGLHNKMVLAEIGGRGTVHIGSINGNEASNKLNRELALQVQSDAAYDYLRELFEADWRSANPAVRLPLVSAGFQGPQRADHLLISEVYYATRPELEWVEIYNPTVQAVDLGGYRLGDAVHADDYESMFQFPPGASIAPGQVLVVAVTATGFRQEFQAGPLHFELYNSDPGVPDLLRYPGWGTGDWGLGNEGDEVLLLEHGGQTEDAVTYGDGGYPGVVPHPGVPGGHALERSPAWLDSDDCSADFRDWPFPSPGTLPQGGTAG